MNQDDRFQVLKDLVELYRMGGLTQAEFQETKRLLLSQLRTSSALSSQTDLMSSFASESDQDLLSESLDINAQLGAPIEPLIDGFQPQPVALESKGISSSSITTAADINTAALTNSAAFASASSGAFASPLAIGEWLMGRYQIKAFLGEGASGKTFLCYDSIRQNHYALKWIHPQLAQIGPVREQFLRLLKDNEKLAHPGFVRTYSVERDTASGMLFFTMEYVAGMTLDRALEHATVKAEQPLLPVTFTLRLVEQLVALLSFAHSQGMLHRNLKPSNIGIMKSGDVKLMDAGMIEAVEEAVTSRHTSFGGVLYYMAPELLRRRQSDINATSDVYSLGAITYQLLTGELPIGAVVPPTQYVPSFPPELDAILLRALEPRPARRYETPQAFWAPLIEALAPMAANEQLRTETLHGMLRATLPELPSSEFPSTEAVQELSETDADTTNEVVQIGSGDGLMAETTTTTSTDLPVVRSVPSSGLLSRSLRTEQKDITEDEIPKVRKSAVLNPLDVPIPSTLSHFPKNDEMISLEGGPTPPPPPGRSVLPSSDLSSEISRISAISSLAVEPLAKELELELEDEEQAGPKAEDFKRSALDLSVLEHLEESTLCAKDGTPLLKLVKVPSGTFKMGSQSNDPLASTQDTPQREVFLDTYWISRTPITNRVWSKFIEESGYHSDDSGYLRHWFGGRPSLDKLEHPVVFVSPKDIDQFCLFYELSLPTEAQWEKASRGDNGNIWPWGNQKPQPGNCNYLGSNIQNTTPVASYPSGMSEYGLYDCSGNTWEWCRDRWMKEWLTEMGASPKNPHQNNPSSGYFTIRGGCFRNYGRGVRCATRHYAIERANHISARVVKAVS